MNKGRKYEMKENWMNAKKDLQKAGRKTEEKIGIG